ncbi:MAG: hypothetical protein WKF87_06775 [Chryseolinea sp.]
MIIWLAQIPAIPESAAMKNLLDTNIAFYMMVVALIIVSYVAIHFYKKSETLTDNRIKELIEENKELKRK